MQIVTLTTDWGTNDFFLGMVKGKLYSSIPDVQVVDITHDVSHFDLIKASFIVKNACQNFPNGTIHIIDICSFDTEDAFVVVEYEKQYYICTDNRLPYSVFGDRFTSVTEIEMFRESNFYNFAAYDLFCKVAAHIANGLPFSEIGRQRNELKKSQPISCICTNDSIKANIMYIDAYGNAYLNVKYEQFAEICKNRPFSVTIQTKQYNIGTLSPSYDYENRDAGLILTVSSTGYLQIALKIASAEQLLNLNVRDNVIIKFQ